MWCIKYTEGRELMSEISVLLSEYIHQKGYSIRALAKRLNIPAATLTKMCNGTRSPCNQKENIQRICDVLMLTPIQRERLNDALEKEILGEAHYTSRRSIKSLLESMNGFFLPERCNIANINLPPLAFAEKKSDVYSIVNAFFENAAAGNSLDVFFQPEDMVVLETLCRVVKSSPVKVRHIIVMASSDGKSGSVNAQNIDNVQKIQPLILYSNKKLNNYQPYYFYDRITRSSGNMLSFPNVFISDQGVLCCSADYTRAIYDTHPDKRRYGRRLFNSQISRCRPLITLYEDALQQIHRYSRMMAVGNHTDIFRTLSWQPCLLWSVTEQEVRGFLSEQLPFRQEYISSYLTYLRKIRERKYIQMYFTQEGLMELVTGGSIREIPDVCLAQEIPLQIRVDLLDRLLVETMAGHIQPHIVREEKMKIGRDAQMISYGADTIVLAALNHDDGNRVCFIEELSSNWSALDFLENLEHTDWILSVEETCSVIRQSIEHARASCVLE